MESYQACIAWHPESAGAFNLILTVKRAETADISSFRIDSRTRSQAEPAREDIGTPKPRDGNSSIVGNHTLLEKTSEHASLQDSTTQTQHTPAPQHTLPSIPRTQMSCERKTERIQYFLRLSAFRTPHAKSQVGGKTLILGASLPKKENERETALWAESLWALLIQILIVIQEPKAFPHRPHNSD